MVTTAIISGILGAIFISGVYIWKEIDSYEKNNNLSAAVLNKLIESENNNKNLNIQIEDLRNEVKILNNNPIILPGRSYPVNYYNLSYIDDDKIIDSYGKYATNVLENSADILNAVIKIYPDFELDAVRTSFPTQVAVIERDKRNFLLVSGCTPHDCGGSENIIAYDLGNKKAYLLKENHQAEILIYGKPDALVMYLLLDYYQK